MATLDVPPGLSEYAATELIQSECLDGAEWDTFHTTKLYTNAFVLNAQRSQARYAPLTPLRILSLILP